MKKLVFILFVVLLGQSVFAKDKIENFGYLSIGYVMPYGTYATSINNAYSKYDNQKYGPSLNLGVTTYINKLKIGQFFKPGLMIDIFNVNTTIISYNVGGSKYSDITGRISPGIGPIVTFACTKKIFCDLYFKCKPTFAFNYIKSPLGEDQGNGLGVFYTPGVNIRLFGINLSADYNIAKMNYEYDSNKSNCTEEFITGRIGFTF